MTQRLAPDSPPLTLHGKEESGPGDIISDSVTEVLDDPTDEEKTQANLSKIAKARKKTAK